MPDLIEDVKKSILEHRGVAMRGRGEGGHITELKGTFFGQYVEDEEYLRALCPDTDTTFLGDLANATKKYGWKPSLEDYQEYTLFEVQYAKVKQYVARLVGISQVAAALQLYERYQKVVEAAVLWATTTGTNTGNFFGPKAKVGAIQWLVRPICMNTFQEAQTDRVFSYTATGNRGVIPRDDAAVTGGAAGDTYTLQTDTQVICIFGYVSNLNPRSISRVQEYVNDGVGKRLPVDIYGQMNMSDVGVATRQGCLVIKEGKNMTIGGDFLEICDSDILPFGVDIISADVTGLDIAAF